jgi:transcriptional regulator with XRE-family HTH domain
VTEARRVVGDAIREGRRARGWSQQRLAEATGVEQHHISSIETGRTGARLDTAARLLGALGLSLYVRNGLAPAQFTS